MGSKLRKSVKVKARERGTPPKAVRHRPSSLRAPCYAPSGEAGLRLRAVVGLRPTSGRAAPASSSEKSFESRGTRFELESFESSLSTFELGVSLRAGRGPNFDDARALNLL